MSVDLLLMDDFGNIVATIVLQALRQRNCVESWLYNHFS